MNVVEAHYSLYWSVKLLELSLVEAVTPDLWNILFLVALIIALAVDFGNSKHLIVIEPCLHHEAKDHLDLLLQHLI